MYLRHATPSRAGSAYSLDVLGGSPVGPTAKIEEPLVKEPAEKKSRPSQHVPTVPAARKSTPPVKGDDGSTGKGGKASAPLPKSSPPPPPKVKVQAALPSSAVPSPAVKPIPAPSVPPKAACPNKRDNMEEGGGPNKKATPPKTPSPSKVGAPAPTAAQHVKHELLARPVATPSRTESRVTKSDVGVSASQASTVPGDVPAPETQLDSQQSSQGQQGDGGCDESTVENKVPADTTPAAAAAQAPPANTATTPTAPKQVTPPSPKQVTPPPPKVPATVAAKPPPPKVPATPPSVKKPPVPKFSENATPKAAAAASPPPTPSQFQVAPGTTPIAPASYNERQAKTTLQTKTAGGKTGPKHSSGVH